MIRNSFYFQHDLNSRNDEKVLMLRAEYGWEGYGLYWAIVESIAETSGGINKGNIAGLSVGLGMPCEKLTEFIEYCMTIGLFKMTEKGRIATERILDHMKFRSERSKSGKKGANSRWATVRASKAIAQPSLSYSSAIAQPIAQPMQRKGKERKVNNIKSTNVDLSDPKRDELRTLITVANEIFNTNKVFSDEAYKKYCARRQKYSSGQITQAFENLVNEYDHWKINNNGQRSMAWWLHSDQRIEDMLSCHLKRPAVPQLKAIIIPQ